MDAKELKRKFGAVAIAVAAGLLWWRIVLPMLTPPPRQAPLAPTTQPEPASQPEGPAPATTTQPEWPTRGPEAPAATGPAVVPSAIPLVGATAPEGELLLGSLEWPKSDRPHYRLQLAIDPRGAGVREARLADYDETVAADSPRYAVINPAETPDSPINLATSAVVLANLPGAPRVPLAGVPWRLAERADDDSSQSITMAVDVGSLLTVEKTYTLPIDSYDVNVSYRLINRTDQPLEVVIEDAGVVRGGLKISAQDEPKAAWGIIAKGYQTPKVTAFNRDVLIGKLADDPKAYPLPATGGEDRLSWVASMNRFFAVIVHPAESRPSLQFRAAALGKDAGVSPFQIAWTSEKIRVEPGADNAATLAFANFIGPKDRKLFTDAARHKPYVLLNYEGLLVAEACFCQWDPLVSLMLWLLDMLYKAVRNYGIAIMVLVAIVRVLLHPLTRKSQVSMTKMSKLQPKIEELKKQYGDNKQELNKAMAEFYKQQGFSPILGCLPMILQMPIWIALWGALSTSIDLRHAPFFWWIQDLSTPDALIRFSRAYDIPLLSLVMGPIHSFNLLPILLMVAGVFQQLLTPKPASGPQANQQRFMGYFMNLFLGVIFYSMPSGLSLYVMASTAVGVGEQYFIRKHIKEREAAEARGELPTKREKPLFPGRPRPRRRR